MRIRHPDIRSYAEHTLSVDTVHQLYVEESGNPEGIPVLFVHGGPGAGCATTDRCFFDPERYRIILFDQRGSGRSVPHAHLDNNTTGYLLEDMESIRIELGIEKWVLFGGSWGSTLSLLYAQSYPEKIMGLILRGIFLCRQQDIDWFYQYGASEVFPDYWQDYVSEIPQLERANFLKSYYQRLTGLNEVERMSAAKQWSVWEARCATLHPNPTVVARFSNPHTALSLARIEAHYFINQCFVEENQIVDQAGKLSGIRGIIVHGRYDMVCPVGQAYTLHQAWPDATLAVIRDAGHAASEPGIVDALVKATDQLADELTGDLGRLSD